MMIIIIRVRNLYDDVHLPLVNIRELENSRTAVVTCYVLPLQRHDGVDAGGPAVPGGAAQGLHGARRREQQPPGEGSRPAHVGPPGRHHRASLSLRNLPASGGSGRSRSSRATATFYAAVVHPQPLSGQPFAATATCSPLDSVDGATRLGSTEPGTLSPHLSSHLLRQPPHSLSSLRCALDVLCVGVASGGGGSPHPAALPGASEPASLLPVLPAQDLALRPSRPHPTRPSVLETSAPMCVCLRVCLFVSGMGHECPQKSSVRKGKQLPDVTYWGPAVTPEMPS